MLAIKNKKNSAQLRNNNKWWAIIKSYFSDGITGLGYIQIQLKLQWLLD